jgi:hypothetical protein
MAARTWTAMAIQSWVSTAFSEVPTNALMRRCWRIHLKKQFDLPPPAVQLDEGQGGQIKMVGDKDQSLIARLAKVFH